MQKMAYIDMKWSNIKFMIKFTFFFLIIYLVFAKVNFGFWTFLHHFIESVLIAQRQFPEGHFSFVMSFYDCSCSRFYLDCIFSVNTIDIQRFIALQHSFMWYSFSLYAPLGIRDARRLRLFATQCSFYRIQCWILFRFVFWDEMLYGLTCLVISLRDLRIKPKCNSTALLHVMYCCRSWTREKKNLTQNKSITFAR